jgi:hypothetical protein
VHLLFTGYYLDRKKKNFAENLAVNRDRINLIRRV